MAGAFLTCLATAEAFAAVDIYGYGALRAGSVESTTSWLEGGFGRFDQGADAAGDSSGFGVAEAQVALDWTPSDAWLIHVQAIARAEDAVSQVDEVGLIEAFVRFQAIDGHAHQLAFTLGQKFLPTSFENTLDLWQSPYTLTYSAWNSWIAHEFRPIGLEAGYTYNLENGSRFGLRANIFGGNDSSGAELAWGGWRFSQRLSTYGEVLPLPDLVSLRDGGGLFFDQRDDGSKPFGPDLDGDPGFAAQARFDSPRFRVRHTWVDNQGDKGLWRGEYAWRTVFNVTGAEWQVTNNFSVLGEVATGSTRMGLPAGAVNVDFDTFYLLASYQQGNHRVSARFDDFELEDRDGFPTDNSEDGDGWTVAYFFEPGAFRVGIEYTDVSVSRVSALESGFNPNHDGSQLTLEVRYVF